MNKVLGIQESFFCTYSPIAYPSHGLAPEHFL